MISTMRQVEIVGPLSYLRPLMDTVQELGTLQLIEIPLYDGAGDTVLHRVRLTEQELQESASVGELVTMFSETLGFLPESAHLDARDSKAYHAQYDRWKGSDIGALAVAARSLHASARSIARRKNNLADDIQAISVYEEAVETISPLIIDLNLPENYELVGLILEMKSKVPRDMLHKELEKLTNGEYLYKEAPLSGKRTAVLVGFDHRLAHSINSLILEKGVGRMSVPRYLRDKPLREAIARMEEDIVALRKKFDSLEAQAKVFYSQKGPELFALFDICMDRHARSGALHAIVTTEHGFALRGWIPSRGFEALKTAAISATEGTAVVRSLQFGTKDSPPVQLDNSRISRQFEPLLKLFPLPRYGTIDPTIYLASIFPPVFGLMMADIGYGLILGMGAALLALFARKKSLTRKLAFIAGSCAFFAILFGVVFGELFGELGKHAFGLEPLWQERFSFTGENKVKTLIGYMAITLAIGVAHVLLALALALINSLRTRDRGKAVDSLAKIAGIFLIFFAVGRMTSLLPPIFTTLGGGALIAFLALMLYQIIHSPAHGFLLPLEVLGTIGNILSYVRIMAVGLVSVVLAFLANLFGEMIGNVALAVIVSLLIHALNLALGIIDPTIQGLRLHYVEFSSKFFLGGGSPYTPFRKSGGSS